MKFNVESKSNDAYQEVYGLPVNINNSYTVTFKLSGEEYCQFIEMVHVAYETNKLAKKIVRNLTKGY